MLKKTITYEDYDGNTRTEDFYFNLSKADLTEILLSYEGGPQNAVLLFEAMLATNDTESMLKTTKKLVAMSYGLRSEGDDGRIRFLRSEKITDEFVASAAYDELIWELSTDAEKATEFFNGILPKNLAGELARLQKEHAEKGAPTLEELEQMSDEEFIAAVGEDEKTWSKDVLLVAFKRKNAPHAA